MRGAALGGAVRAATAVAAPAAAPAAALLPALDGRGALRRAAFGRCGHGRVGGAGGHRFSLPRRLRTRRRCVFSLGVHMLAWDQRCAREFVLWGATLRAARLGTDWCSFLSEHCPVVTMSGGLLREEGPARRAWGKTGSRRLNQTLSGLHSTLKCPPPSASLRQGPDAGPGAAGGSSGTRGRPVSRRARALPRTSARPRRPGSRADPRGRASR